MKAEYLVLVFIATFSLCSVSAQKVIVYQKPNSIQGSNLFKVVIKQANKVYNSFVYVSKTSLGTRHEWGHQVDKTFNYAIFSFEGKISIEVTKFNSLANKVIVRSGRYQIENIKLSTVNHGKTVSFNLAHSSKLSIEFNDDSANKNALLIFANTLEKVSAIPNSQGSSVVYVQNDNDILNIRPTTNTVYFSPGIHTIGYWSIPKNITQIYIPGGSFIRGYFYADRYNAAPIMVNGRGIISNDIYPFLNPTEGESSNLLNYAKWYKTLTINGGSKSIIEGLTFTDASSVIIKLHTDSCLIENVNINGFRYTNNGVSITGSHNLIKECFFHVNDDAIELYGNNTTVSKCIFWQLSNGSIIQLAWFPHSVKGGVVKNCSVLHAEWGKNYDGDIGFLTAINISNKTNQNTFSEEKKVCTGDRKLYNRRHLFLY